MYRLLLVLDSWNEAGGWRCNIPVLLKT